MILLKNIIRVLFKALPQSLIYFYLKLRLKKHFKDGYNAIKNNKDTVNDFKDAIYSYGIINRNNTGIFIDSYNKKLVRPVKIAKNDSSSKSPILVCAVKNELTRIKLQINYHRKIGIKHFVYIDNISNDGTMEWLNNEDDVSIFSVDEKFHPCAKNSWRRQITDFFGYNKWYMILDADELFIYPGIETNNIEKYINYLDKKNITCAFAPMIDMYSMNKLFNGNTEAEDIFNEYCYFDTDTYNNEKQLIRQFVTGGPRERLFGKSNTNSKYPLIYLTKNMLIGTHENHPYKYNHQSDGAIAFLLHYKFLSNDENKYRENAVSNLYGQSFMYKTYMNTFDNNPDMSFFCNNSQKLNDSLELLKINIIDNKFFNNFLHDK